MGVLKIISKNNHEYIFVKQVNKNMFLYTKMRNVAGLSTSEAQKSSDMFAKCRYNECFTKFDLGMVKEIIEPPKTEIKPEKVKFL